MSAQESPDNTDHKIRTVVIDPGHGGRDPGAVGKNSKEKDVVLTIGLKLGKYIEENIPDVKVIYTRKTDVLIPLYKRAEIANEANADLFISIHANGLSNPSAHGTETLVLGLHRSDENFEVAKRENSVILLEEDYTTRYENFDPESHESYIIFSLMQNIYDHQSVGFAGLVQDQFRNRVNRVDRGVKRLGLLVLAQISMPGVLVETGFITNADEEKFLLSEQGQDYIASAIFRAFRDYKQDIESKAGKAIVTEINETDSTPDPPAVETSIPEEIQAPADTLTLSDGKIYYKVQILTSSASLDVDSPKLKDFADIEAFATGNGFKYAVGYKESYEEVVIYSKWVKNRYPDAFIIAVQDGRIIPVKTAREHQSMN